MDNQLATLMGRIGMILEFVSFWLVAPEIIGESRLEAFGMWLRGLNRRLDDLARNRWVGYVMSALLFGLAAFLAGGLQDSPAVRQLPIYPGGWDYISPMPIAVLATFTVIYSQFAVGIWFVANGWLGSNLSEFRIVGRVGVIIGCALFSYGLGFMTFELIQALSNRAQWWLALIVIGWGVACVVLWVLMTFHFTNWSVWLITIIIYNFGAWTILHHIAGGTASSLGGAALIGLLSLNMLASAPLVERFAFLMVRKRPLRMQLLIIGAVVYVVSFLLQFGASF